MGSTLWVLITLAVLSAWPFSAWAGGAHEPRGGIQGPCPLAAACSTGGLRPDRVGLTSLSVEPQQLALAEVRGELDDPSHVLATFAFQSGVAEGRGDLDVIEQAPVLAWGGAASWPDLHWSADAESDDEAVKVAAVGSLSYRVFDPARGFSTPQANDQSGEGDGGSPTTRGVSDALIAAVLALIGVVAVARRTPMKA